LSHPEHFPGIATSLSILSLSDIVAKIMASTSSATGFAGNCESTSNNGPTFAPFGRNVEGAVMANWLKAVKLEIDPVVLGQISGMMSQQPEELEVQMQQEIESISGIGKFNSPTSSFHLDATYLSSEIPRNSNELGYSHGNGYGYDHGYGCDGIPENVPQFVDPSLTFTTGYEPASSYSVAPDHRLFPSPGVDTMDALCNADILRHGAQFSEPFLFPDSIAYEPTNSAQLSQMGPNHLPTMGCGIHRPMTPDAILSDGIMTPGHSCKSTHAKNGAIHHSGAASSLVSNELITPTKARNSTVKPRNSTPATPCRQTRSKTGKHSLAETPESVNSYGAESSQSEAFSPDATTCRNGNTHVLPKGGAKAVTAKDKLIEIEAVEVMGFGFSYVRKMQDEGRSPHPTIYNSLDEAKHAQFDHLLANEHDSTIPTTVAQKKVLVGFLMVAMKDLEVTNDGKKATSPWKKKVYTDEHIEQSAWAALVSDFSFHFRITRPPWF
jgi:hypothetical protein